MFATSCPRRFHDRVGADKIIQQPGTSTVQESQRGRLDDGLHVQPTHLSSFHSKSGLPTCHYPILTCYHLLLTCYHLLLTCYHLLLTYHLLPTCIICFSSVIICHSSLTICYSFVITCYFILTSNAWSY